MRPTARYGQQPSPREAQVAISMLFGHSAAETAAELGISRKTVFCYRERLYAKFGAHSAAGLAAILIACPMPQREAAE
jgi:DNA-binding CsgD family transcriptional regulator